MSSAPLSEADELILKSYGLNIMLRTLRVVAESIFFSGCLGHSALTRFLMAHRCIWHLICSCGIFNPVISPSWNFIVF